MNFGFVDEHRHVLPVRSICTVLGVSVSGYYAWRQRPESRRSVDSRTLLSDIAALMPRAADVTARRASMPCCGPPADASDVTVSRA